MPLAVKDRCLSGSQVTKADAWAVWHPTMQSIRGSFARRLELIPWTAYYLAQRELQLHVLAVPRVPELSWS